MPNFRLTQMFNELLPAIEAAVLPSLGNEATCWVLQPDGNLWVAAQSRCDFPQIRDRLDAAKFPTGVSLDPDARNYDIAMMIGATDPPDSGSPPQSVPKCQVQPVCARSWIGREPAVYPDTLGTGTLGWIVSINGTLSAVSCYHVLCDSDSMKPDSVVYAWPNGIREPIGRLSWFEKMCDGNPYHDLAIVAVDSKVALSASFLPCCIPHSCWHGWPWCHCS